MTGSAALGRRSALRAPTGLRRSVARVQQHQQRLSLPNTGVYAGGPDSFSPQTNLSSDDAAPGSTTTWSSSTTDGNPYTNDLFARHREPSAASACCRIDEAAYAVSGERPTAPSTAARTRSSRPTAPDQQFFFYTSDPSTTRDRLSASTTSTTTAAAARGYINGGPGSIDGTCEFAHCRRAAGRARAVCRTSRRTPRSSRTAAPSVFTPSTVGAGRHAGDPHVVDLRRAGREPLHRRRSTRWRST